uniref:TLDc domain-containing protein n=1 Tax=Panagrolaimus sp. ES5 TaxID=591445 RepID=A0AC34G581_9BILA
MKKYEDFKRKKLEEAFAIIFSTSSKTENSRRCAFAYDSKIAITFRHGVYHKSFYVGKILNIYNVNTEEQVKVGVLLINEQADIIVLLRLFGEFSVYPQSVTHSSNIGDKYWSIGVHGSGLYCKQGHVQEFSKKYIIGSSQGRYGDSGSAILSELSLSLMGMVRALTDFDRRQIDPDTCIVKSAATHECLTVILPASVIANTIPTVQEGDDEDIEQVD